MPKDRNSFETGPASEISKSGNKVNGFIFRSPKTQRQVYDFCFWSCACLSKKLRAVIDAGSVMSAYFSKLPVQGFRRMIQHMLQSDPIFRLQHIGPQLPIEFGFESICSN
jgi:hypothetical protein